MDKISPIFGESITTGKIKRRNYENREESRGLRFYLVPVAIIAVVFLHFTSTFFPTNSSRKLLQNAF